MNVNIWLILTATAKNALRPLMSDDSYDGQHLKAVKIFRKMAHFAVVERMWKNPMIGSKKRFLFSINLTASKKAKAAIDYLLAEYPNQIAVGGAWFFDGRQVGTRFVYTVDGSQIFDELLDDDGNVISSTPQVRGTPTYPINETQLLKFMPDIIERDQEGSVTSTTPATVLTDVNLLQGQEPRRFT